VPFLRCHLPPHYCRNTSPLRRRAGGNREQVLLRIRIVPPSSGWWDRRKDQSPKVGGSRGISALEPAVMVVDAFRLNMTLQRLPIPSLPP
jgi:hypothetical protein